MEWNAKWDWESLAMFSSKACEEGDGSFNLSDVGPGSSAKSTISASTNSSSPKDSNFALKEKTKQSSTEASKNSGETWIGLRLGKRTYFENNNVVGNTMTKTRKQPSQTEAVPRCQVEGCNLDLSSAKDYHRKHRVCETHSKYPKVVVGGVERRFCQQCSRFHGLSEFDEKKRSCRRRLSDHNARRRKPHHDTFQFNSARLSSSFYDGRQQISFVLNSAPTFYSKTASNLTWENSYASEFTVTKGFSLDRGKTERVNKQAYVSATQSPNVIDMDSNASDTFLPPKGVTAEGFTQGVEKSVFPIHTGTTTQEFPRALSLLSNSSWGSCEHDSTSLHHSNQTGYPEIPLGLPIPQSEYWQPEPNQTGFRGQFSAANANTSGHLQDIPPFFKGPQETADFYLNAFN